MPVCSTHHDLLPLDRAAEYLGIDEDYLRRLLVAGALEAHDGHSNLISVKELDSFRVTAQHDFSRTPRSSYRPKRGESHE